MAVGICRRVNSIRAKRYSEELWFLMHHSSGNPDHQLAAVLTCYVDDSGTHEQSKSVVLGGLFMDHQNFVRFDKKWRTMLYRYKINSLHMTDFVRPHGIHIGMHAELKIALFTEAVAIVNARKVESVTVAIDHAEFKASVPETAYRKAFSPYVSAFLHLARSASERAYHSSRLYRIAYLIDQGSFAAEQIRVAHAIEQAWEKQHRGYIRTGALAFDSDDNATALQAADMIAWSYQRKLAKKLTGEFFPLTEIFKERFDAYGAPGRTHWCVPVKDDNASRVMKSVKSDGQRLHNEALHSLNQLAKAAKVARDRQRKSK
jgi:hypothetical protein